ncbi:MAG TPA: leucine-rich repeat protein [Paludibacter sp.]
MNKIPMLLLFLNISLFAQAKSVDKPVFDLRSRTMQVEMPTLDSIKVKYSTLKKAPILRASNAPIATVQKTVNLPVAGTLNAFLTETEKSTITDLTITGSMDARDFRIIRDNMSLLSIIDLSGVSIVSYTGLGGSDPFSTNSITYLANTVPIYAFCLSSLLESVKLPSTTQSIGISAFEGCVSLTSITLPSNLKAIEHQAFDRCIKINDITIPASVITIGDLAFAGCSALITVDSTNIDYSSLDGLLFNKTKSRIIQCPISKSGSYSIPTSVQKIGDYCFYNCSKLTSIYIPNSVDTIGNGAFCFSSNLNNVNIPASVLSIRSDAFNSCTGLKSIILNGYPPQMLGGTFYPLKIDNCTLTVPYGSKGLYATANEWCDFTKVVEKPQGFILNANSILFDSDNGSSATAMITSNVSWNATSNATWLKIEPNSGISDTIFSIQTEANSSFALRTAILTISSDGFQSQIIRVSQLGSKKTILLSNAGTLSNSLTPLECLSVSALKLVGKIDASDIKFLRDNLPSLSYLDLSETTIMYYKGTNGTVDGGNIAYEANEMPEGSFYHFIYASPISNFTLNTILLPNSVTTIGDGAFRYCFELTRIVIPECVKSINEGALQSCFKLTEIRIPDSLKSIGRFAFAYCFDLRSLSIPSGVVSIDECAFYNCTQLTSIYAYPLVPVNLSQSSDVFHGINKSKCTLFVHNEAKEAYMNQVQWKDFTILKELKDLNVSKSRFLFLPAGNSEKFKITSNTDWSISSDQSWLKISQDSGSNDAEITLTADQCKAKDNRTAVLTLRPIDSSDQTIVVNQEGFVFDIVGSTTINTDPSNGSVLKNLDIYTNTYWTTSSNQDWLKINPPSGVGDTIFTITWTSNPTILKRNAVISVSAPLYGVTKTISVLQNDGYLNVSKPKLDFSNKVLNAQSVSVFSNESWITSCDKDWVEMTQSTKSDNGILTIKASENKTPYTRSAIVTITLPINGLTVPIEVTQQCALFVFTPTIIKKWNDVLICDDHLNNFETFQWYKNDVAIEGSTQQYYYNPKGLNGDYLVVASNRQGKLGVSNIIHSDSLSTESIMSIFSKDLNGSSQTTIHINLPNNELNLFNVAIYTVKGEQVCIIKDLQEINYVKLKGDEIYFVQLITNSGFVKESKKLIANHL